MDKEKTLEFENDEIKYYVHERIGVMKFKRTAFENIADIEKAGDLMYLFEWVEKDKGINALLLLNEPRAYGIETYNNFIETILIFNEEESRFELKDSAAKIIRARQMNSIRNLITKIMDFKKIFIMGMLGNVVTPFFGLSLAADFRFGAEDMQYMLEHKKYSLHPSGALPFFLPRYLNKSMAVDLLYQGYKIPADRSQELGLINEVFPVEDFENSCIVKAKSIARIDPEVMRLTKKLTFSHKADLERYFNLESKLIGF